MASDDIDWGCLVTVAVVAIGGYMAYEKYWAVEEIQAPPPIIWPSPLKPTGPLLITTLEKGGVWRLNADTVKGPRSKRVGWMEIDYSKDKSVSFREIDELWQVNCETESYQKLSIAHYDAKGKPLSTEHVKPEDAEINYAIPRTNAAIAVLRMCDPRFDGPAPTPSP